MDRLRTEVDRVAGETAFSGAVRVDVRGDALVDAAYGFADRECGTRNTPSTRFAIASGSKAFTALAVMRLVEERVLGLATSARTLLGRDLPMIADDVTVFHLLAHRSGIGDYLNEDAIAEIAEFIPPVDVRTLDTIEAFLAWLDGHPTAFPAGTDFAYCNGGYMVLALIAERAAGQGFHELVADLVTGPAGLGATGYLRSDALPPDAARGYLYDDDHPDRLRTNADRLPVRGGGDGGAYTTTGDLRTFWEALLDARIVSEAALDLMLTAHTPDADSGVAYGLGFWLPDAATIQLDGYDAGVSFRSVHDRAGDRTWTVIANWTDGAWPVTRRVRELLGRD